MRTPKEYTDNLKNRVITKSMLSDCLFSVNKRAKNCRDQERAYRRYRQDYYGNVEKYQEQKEAYYRQKDKMLSLLTPDCIHAETIERSKWIYDYEDEYTEHYRKKDYIYENRYFDKEMDMFVVFIDIPVPEKMYYLFYDLGNHSFHTPIYDNDLEKYTQLKIEDIGQLITHGEDIGELLSTQFVKKVISLIGEGDFRLELA